MSEQKIDKDQLENKLLEFKRIINSVLIQQRYYFFNIMLHRFSWKIDYTCSEDHLGHICFRNENINEVENGTIYVGAWAFAKDDFKVENFLFLLIHELFHITFLHGPRRKGRDRYIWNMAADQVINNLIKDVFDKFQKEVYPYHGYGKNGGCICYSQFGGRSLVDRSLTTEDVYEIFKQEMDQFEIEMTDDSFTITDLKTGKKYVVSVSKEGGRELSDEESAALSRFSRIAKEAFYHAQSRGSIPNSLTEVFKKFFNTELPWDKILEDIISKSYTSKPNSRGWKTLNKFFLPHGYTLPGLIYDIEPNIGLCIVSIDTSASITSDNLQKFANILVESLDHFEKIIMITHDSAIHQVEEFEKINKDQLINFISSVGLQGRGGTSHKDVFDKIQEIQNQSYEGIDLYLSLTDGYSDIEAFWSKNDWSYKDEISTCFILTKDSLIPKICHENQKVKYVIMKESQN